MLKASIFIGLAGSAVAEDSCANGDISSLGYGPLGLVQSALTCIKQEMVLQNSQADCLQTSYSLSTSCSELLSGAFFTDNADCIKSCVADSSDDCNGCGANLIASAATLMEENANSCNSNDIASVRDSGLVPLVDVFNCMILPPAAGNYVDQCVASVGIAAEICGTCATNALSTQKAFSCFERCLTNGASSRGCDACLRATGAAFIESCALDAGFAPIDQLSTCSADDVAILPAYPEGLTDMVITCVGADVNNVQGCLGTQLDNYYQSDVCNAIVDEAARADCVAVAATKYASSVSESCKTANMEYFRNTPLLATFLICVINSEDADCQSGLPALKTGWYDYLYMDKAVPTTPTDPPTEPPTEEPSSSGALGFAVPVILAVIIPRL